MAEGGAVKRMRFCAHGKPHMEGCEYARGGTVHSEQGRDIRYANKIKESDPEMHELSKDFAKHEAKGRAEMERTIKPKMKGLAEGGPVRKMYADPTSPVDENDEAPASLRQPNAGPEDMSKFIGQAIAHAANTAYGKGGNPGEIPEEQTAFEKSGVPAAASKWLNSPDYSINNQVPPAAPQTSNQPVQPQQAAPMAAQDVPQDTPQDDSQDQPQPQSQQPDSMQGQPQQAAPRSAAPTPEDQIYSPPGHELSAEDAAWQQDLVNQHITPKTYASLFADKSTLGKAATIFGMLAGSAGNNDHTLEMMDKVIQNDLQAQTTSKANAQNFLRLSYAHQVQKAQARGLDATSENTRQQTHQLVLANAKMLADRSMLHTMALQVDALPPGPAKTAQQQSLYALMQKQNQDHMNMADQINISHGMYQAEQNGGTTAPDKEAAWQSKNKMLLTSPDPLMQARGKFEQERHVPGIEGLASKPLTQGDMGAIQAHNQLDTKVRELQDFIKKNQTIKGQINPNAIKRGKELATQVASSYNGTIDNLGMSQGRSAWIAQQIHENPISLWNKWSGNNATLEQVRAGNLQRKNLLLSGQGGLGFPPQPNAQQAAQYREPGSNQADPMATAKAWLANPANQKADPAKYNMVLQKVNSQR